MARYLRSIMVIVLAIAIIVSCTVLGSKMTDPATYSHTIEMLDKNRTTVLGLSAASAAASAAISVLPGDVCSSLADQLSRFTTWFLLILCIVYLEKYLITIFGAAACYLLIPVGCGAILTYCFFPMDSFRRLGVKLIAFAMALLLVIPTSVWVSDQINSIYSKSIEITVESANAASENLVEPTSNDDEETTVIDRAKTIFEDVSGTIGGIVIQFKNVLNRFVEATAVMIVTNCLIPILVVVFFAWIVKTLFGIQIVVPERLLNPAKKHLGKKLNSNEKEDSMLLESTNEQSQ